MFQDLKGKFYPTAIGSLPFKDSKTAFQHIINNFTDIPFWPQLVRRSFLENMYCQYSEKLPGIIIDSKEKRIFADTAKDLSKAIEALYEKVISDDVDYFSISKEYARGLYEAIEVLSASKNKLRFFKGQVTGPVSFGLTVTDEKKRSLFHNPELREALIKTLTMRTRWQIRKIKEFAEHCIMFIDEPYLASIGSSYISLNKNEALAALNEVIEGIHKEGASCGIHCCGNTDWGFVLGTDIDVLSFDAYNFSETLALYPGELKTFLRKGGLLAWGIIPNGQDINTETTDSLEMRLEKAVEQLAKKGFKEEEIYNSMLITPSCGLGLIDEELCSVVIKRTCEFAKSISKKVGYNGK